MDTNRDKTSLSGDVGADGFRNGTCRLAVELQHFTQYQLVGVQSEGVAEHAHRDEVHVAVGGFCLVCAGAVKVPFRKVCHRDNRIITSDNEQIVSH